MDKTSNPVDLTIYNPRKAEGSLEEMRENADRRLEHVYLKYRALGDVEWSQAQLEDLTAIDFANIPNGSKWKEDSYGYTTVPWDIAKRLTLADDGVYEVVVESTCTKVDNTPKDFNAIQTEPIHVIVDRVEPKMYGKALPIRDVVVPGEEVIIVFTEPIRCDMPYRFGLEVTLSGLDKKLSE